MTSAVLPLDFKRLEQLYAAGLHDGFIDTAIQRCARLLFVKWKGTKPTWPDSIVGWPNTKRDFP